MAQDRPAAGIGVGRLLLHDRARLDEIGEEVAVPAGLEQEEDAVEHHRQHRERHRLERRQRAVRGRGGEVRDDERDGGERDDRRQIGAGPVEVVVLAVVAQAAEDQPEPDETVHHDHDDGEHRVAPERRGGLGPEHHGGDQRHLDDDDRQGQDQGAVGLAEAVGQFLGLVHHPEGRPQDDGEQPGEQTRRHQRRLQPPEPAPAEHREGRHRRPRHRQPHDHHLSHATPFACVAATVAKEAGA